MTAASDSNPPPAGSSIFVGIDVALGKLDIARTDRAGVVTLANDSNAHQQLIHSLLSASPAMIVVEATGGIERPLLDALLDAQLPVALVQPGLVRHFAKGLGILAKTDGIDARVLAIYAQKAEPRLAQKRSKNRTELDALTTCRRQLLHVQTEQGNRRRMLTSKAARVAIDQVLKAVDEQIRSLNRQIEKLIESDDDMSTVDKRLRSVPASER